jgi:hypothetical protein
VADAQKRRSLNYRQLKYVRERTENFIALPLMAKVYMIFAPYRVLVGTTVTA